MFKVNNNGTRRNVTDVVLCLYCQFETYFTSFLCVSTVVQVLLLCVCTCLLVSIYHQSMIQFLFNYIFELRDLNLMEALIKCAQICRLFFSLLVYFCLLFDKTTLILKFFYFQSLPELNKVDFRGIMDVSLENLAKSTDSNDLKILLSLENPCTFLL